jgi:hypothetical protein
MYGKQKTNQTHQHKGGQAEEIYLSPIIMTLMGEAPLPRPTSRASTLWQLASLSD